MFGLFLSSGGGIQKKTDMIKFGSEFPTFCPTTRAWLSLVKLGTNSQFPTFCPKWCCAFGIGGVVEPKK